MRGRPVAVLAALALAAALLPRGGAPRVAAGEATQAGWDEVVAPFLERHCVSCHGRPDPEARVLLEGRAAGDLARDPATWRDVLEQLREGRMPPEDADARPTALEVDAVVEWLEAALGPAREAAAQDPGRVTVRRLNKAEYRHTLQDLLGADVPFDADFPDDDVGYGFDTVGDVLTVPPLLVERYLQAAEKATEAAIRDLEPVQLRFEAEALPRDDGHVDGEGFAWLFSNGAFTASVRFPAPGEYRVRVRALAQQAGDQPARLAIRAGRERLALHDVRAVRGAPEVYEARLKLDAPARRDVAAAFVNDYWKPDHPDPAQRDRNLGVDWLEVTGPDPPPGPGAAQRRLVPRRPASTQDVAACAREALAPFVDRAFRRPARAGEVERYVALAGRQVAEGASFEGAVRVAFQAVLLSPHFLYKVELDPDPASAAPHALSDHELAVRLSYFLWSSTPDEELRALADRGALRPRLREQALRLLDHPRAARFVEQFAGQWLQLRRLAQVSPDPGRFAFDEALRDAMRLETELLFEAVLREGRGALELLDAPFTFVDERLARHYGLAGVEGPRFRRVSAPPGRGGVLGHAGVLTVTSNPTRTSPVKRGKWILEVLLDEPPPQPLPGMDSLAEAREGQPLTLRARLERHRADAACATCHVRMDPLGFGLERFDAVGLLRDHEDDGLPIDDRATLPDGQELVGLEGLQAWLRGRGRAFVRALAAKLLVFALGRGPAPGDDAALDALVEATEPGGWRLRDVVVAVVETRAFRTRRGGLR